MRRLDPYRTWLLYVGVWSLARSLGWTFKSGAEDAWLADEVGREGLARAYQRGAQVGRALSLAGIGGAVALGLVDLRLPLVAAGVVLLALGLFLAAAMPETGFRPAPRHEVRAVRPLVETTRAGGRLVRARPVLLLIVGITFFGGMWSEGFDSRSSGASSEPDGTAWRARCSASTRPSSRARSPSPWPAASRLPWPRSGR